jgi:hypothetical protein
MGEDVTYLIDAAPVLGGAASITFIAELAKVLTGAPDHE